VSWLTPNMMIDIGIVVTSLGYVALCAVCLLL